MEQDFPLECDWMLQDLAACGYPCTDPSRTAQYPLRWLGPWADKNVEKTFILHAADELGDQGKRFQAELENLDQPETQPHSAAWLELYARVCRTLREQRLRSLEDRCPDFIFTKHFNMGGSHYAFTEGLSDAQSERHFIPGAALCRCEITDGVPTVHTLLDDPKGVIRDPDVACDGTRVLFSWKKSDRRDDYHLYEMDLASGEVRQLTSGLGFADYEGVYLPSGDLLFNSSRCVQVVDCFFTALSQAMRRGPKALEPFYGPPRGFSFAREIQPIPFPPFQCPW